MYRWVVTPVIAAMVLAMALAPAGAQAAARSVNAWVTVRSVSPGVGCEIPVAVEVREAGEALAGVDVLGGLVVGGSVVSSVRAVTDSQGIGYLQVATAGAPAGTGRVEVSLAGSYLGAVSVALVDGGSCESGSQVLSATASIWYDPVAAPVSQPAAPAAAAPVATGASIAVPTYVQQRNLSCEYAALQIATGAWGYAISEYNFDAAVGWSANPHYGYRGSITGWWGNTTDYGVYNEPLARALPQFGYVGDAFYAVGDSGALTDRLDAGIPVLVWLGFWGDTAFYETGSDGVRFQLTPGLHVVVAAGYDQWGVTVSDPALGTYRTYDWATFMAMWNVMDGMGLGVYPA